MSRKDRLLAAALAAAIFVPALSSAADQAAAPAEPAEAVQPQARVLDRADLESWLDGMLPFALDSGDIAGVVITVVKDGTVLLEKGYGYADVAQRRPMDPEQTMVRIGSTSKLFTWTAVMQLVEQGKLDLDRDVNDYLDFRIPEDFGKPVTLRDLMNHRGGFEEGLKDVLRLDPVDVPSSEAYLKEHMRPMLFPPGQVPAYSNYGASLAGYIVERVSGMPFERYLDAHILAPLGMTRTSFDQPLPARFEGQYSLGYRQASMPPGAYEQIVTRAAGSGTATAADMARFMLVHLQQGRFGDAQLLRPETVELMHSPSHEALPGFSTMAHGFFRGTNNGRLVIGHGGDTLWFHTELDLLPEEGVGLFYSFNSRGRDDAVYRARYALFEGFMDRYFPDAAAAPGGAAPAALASALTDAQAIAGHYESSRRVEHGLMSIFYVLQQSAIAANADGTISAPGFLEPAPVTFREIGPQVWRDVKGSRQLALRTVDGIKTVEDSDDPTSVLQAVPFRRSAGLNLGILLGASIVLVLTVVAWILTPLWRGFGRFPDGAVPEVRRDWRILRIAVTYDVLYLFAWCLVLAPLLSLQLDVYRDSLDPVIRALQVAGVLAVVAAALGLRSAWRLSRRDVPVVSRGWAWLAAASLVGVAWVAYMGGLLRFSLNY
jgi:CubicO group peptidase (beta-lactamase class C family)